MFKYTIQSNNRIKNDIIVLIILLIVAIGSFLAGYLRSDTDCVVSISVDGKKYATYSLDEDAKFTVEGIGGKNKVEISDSNVSVISADCKDKICLKQGSISKAGESIICLPHRIVITIEKSDNLDAADYDEVDIISN